MKKRFLMRLKHIIALLHKQFYTTCPRRHDDKTYKEKIN
jgi:hypothetical protein